LFHIIQTQLLNDQPITFQAPVTVQEQTVVPIPSSLSPRVVATLTIPAGAILVGRSFDNGTSDTLGEATGLYVGPADPTELQMAGTSGVLSVVLDLSFSGMSFAIYCMSIDR
jgi:hypothetical protein